MKKIDYKKNSGRLYSIVVPVYGVEKYLGKCVESLIEQSYGNIEIILVNDGSKDESPAICEFYKSLDSRITVIHKENGGLVSARKAGALKASGEYIFCVDGDDWISKQYIEKFDNIISKYEPDIVCCGLVQAYNNSFENKEIFLSEGYYDKKLLKEKIYPIAIEDIYGVSFPHNLCSKAFKRGLYISEQLSVNDNIKIGEDSVVVKPLLSKCQSVYVLKDCLYYYRQNIYSMTKSKNSFDWKGPLYMYTHLIDRVNLQQGDFCDQIYRRTVRALYAVVISQFNRDSDYSQIKKDIVNNLNIPEYQFVLSKCRYRGLKQKIELFLIKNGYIGILYIIYMIKHKWLFKR